jgi:hypothetical protein
MEDRIQIKAKELLCGAYDLHTHTIPSHLDRALDDIDLVRQASEAGMAGVVIKNHYEPTGARAQLVNRHHFGTARAYGTVVLNHPVGGLNAYAVYSALEMGASLVFMPTRDAENCLRDASLQKNFFARPGISILDETGRLKKEVFDIMDIVKKYGAALATGHISPLESEILCREGLKRGVRMVLTHPEWYRTTVPLAIQKELARQGAWIEKCFYNLEDGSCTAAEMASHIRSIGASHCFMTTDRGQYGKALPAVAMESFIQSLLREGIRDPEIALMLREVPREVLGLK